MSRLWPGVNRKIFPGYSVGGLGGGGGALTTILDVFRTAPIDNYFIDQSDQNNNVLIKNCQSALFPATNAVILNAPSIDFTGVSSVTYRTKFIWNSAASWYPVSFDGYSAAAKGFAARFTTSSTVCILLISNGTTNATLTASTSTWGLTNGKLCDITIVFNLNGANTITVNGIQRFTQTSSIGGSFLIPATHRVNNSMSAGDVHVTYSELVGYFKYHYQEGAGATVFDTTGNGRHATVATNSINWNSFYGNYPVNLINGVTLNGSVKVPGKDDKSTDCQGNAIQYPAGSGIISDLPEQYTIPTNENLNTIITDGDYTWDQIDALTESANLLKTKTGNAITSLIVKKN